MSRASWLVFVVGSLSGCGEPPPPAAPATTPSVAFVGKPRCGPGTESSPPDAQARMKGFEGDVRACFTLGTPGKAATTVEVSVSVQESGKVSKVRVVGATGNPSAENCVSERLKKATFGPFCGAEVEIRWTYALQ